VYCEKPFSRQARKDWPTIEHLSEKPPFYWNDGLKEEGLVICCWSCNSSRGNRTLRDWFQSSYCLERINPINESTVAAAVRDFLRSVRSNPLMQPTGLERPAADQER
jgi:hypothetical protein